jgi:hypothetical protein
MFAREFLGIQTLPLEPSSRRSAWRGSREGVLPHLDHTSWSCRICRICTPCTLLGVSAANETVGLGMGMSTLPPPLHLRVHAAVVSQLDDHFVRPRHTSTEFRKLCPFSFVPISHPSDLADEDHDELTRSVEWDHMVPDLNVVYPSTNTLDDTAALMSQDDGKSALGILAREGVGVGVADTGAVSVSELLAMRGYDIWVVVSEWERESG